MIKFLGCILIITSSTFLGFSYAENFRKRVKQLKELQNCLYELRNEIIYAHVPLIEAFNETSERANYPVNLIFKCAAENLNNKTCNSVYEAFKFTFASEKFDTNLKYEDKRIILNLSKSLGETDVDGQIKVFDLAVESIKKNINDAEETMKKNVKMYRCLGFCVGAMITIMLI
ncbi:MULTISPECIES: stage III sporulation protein SpoIIIAB [Clostridium]|uniref:stage III sporulation protein SpoIIIAB n=1 Tax=Clostridium TaxID=1485 RepID=UPI0008253F9D|nr:MULTISPECIES: stage III sporulation protein SpoIIIAB [Clostridium]PJI09929.1 stage III sporulation protein SpoAB [Clostridium sp. CT7]